MGKDDAFLKTLEARLVSAGVTDPGSSARATLRYTPRQEDTTFESSGLELESTLGEGGMGVVVLATQRALDRKVAVKTVREKSVPAIIRLVREAKITGALEHPNIVPVHDLTTGPDGVPRLVLKRVEGTTWTARMRDEPGVREQFGARDLLEWNVQTLMAVCQGVHFANSRGVIHRDLKPDNVMVGSFGEVYVVDWGIAVREGEKHDSDGMVGTPVYLAPEMLVGEPVDQRTDVYLLGGMLYEILTGRAPHDFTDLQAIIKSVLATPPPVPDRAPDELARLARACLARDPAERPASAEDVRRALADFLRHRDGAALAASAAAKVNELVAALRGGDAKAQRLYGECVFGFRASLEAWPENPHGKSGLVRVVRAMVEHDLEHGVPETAALHLLDLPEPVAELDDRVRRGLHDAEERARHVEALKRMQVDLDPATGQRIRVRVSAGLCLIWMASDMFDQGVIRGSIWETHAYYTAQSGVHLAITIAVIAGYWRFFRHSMLNRQLAGMVAFCMAAQVAAHGGAWFAGYSLQVVQIGLLFLWFTVMGAVSTMLVPAMWPSALSFLIGFFVAAAAPNFRHAIGAVTNLTLLVNAALAWRASTESDRKTWTG